MAHMLEQFMNLFSPLYILGHQESWVSPTSQKVKKSDITKLFASGLYFKIGFYINCISSCDKNKKYLTISWIGLLCWGWFFSAIEIGIYLNYSKLELDLDFLFKIIVENLKSLWIFYVIQFNAITSVQFSYH